ncbi:unnamed protein product, partial [Prorocentrum cordatum]
SKRIEDRRSSPPSPLLPPAAASVSLVAPLPTEWWLLPEADEAARSGACEAAGSGLRACALRVKMSEFLCLTAHVEACDLLRGTVADDQCLAAAPCLAALLRGALGAEGENGFGAASDVRRHLISPACVSGEHICIRTCWF